MMLFTLEKSIEIEYTLLCHCLRQSKFAQIAQSVEQGTENPRVGGSIPPLGTKNAEVAQW